MPVRWIGEQHMKEDLGWIPTAADWLACDHAGAVYARAIVAQTRPAPGDASCGARVTLH